MPPTILTQAYRPFFPLAALYAAVGMLYWLAGLSGMLPLPAQPTLWHAHEMLFGFAGAVLAGFVLTTVVNWTGQPSTTPASLVLFVVIWLAARILLLVPQAAVQESGGSNSKQGDLGSVFVHQSALTLRSRSSVQRWLAMSSRRTSNRVTHQAAFGESASICSSA